MSLFSRLFSPIAAPSEPAPAYLNLTRNEKIRILKEHDILILSLVQRIDVNELLRTGVQEFTASSSVYDAQVMVSKILTSRMLAELQTEIDQEKSTNAEREVQRLLDKRKKK